jgi:metallo-beta-lactamase superfamily protein
MAVHEEETRKKNGGKMTPSSFRLRIRMYRVGLGDCFLLTFSTSPVQHMLIDCGMFAGSGLDEEKEDKELHREIASNIADETGNTLDVVVITHEHMDHVSIFNSQKDIFEKMEFKQVWVGWVEDPDNKDARELRKRYEGLETALAQALTGLQGLSQSDPEEYKRLHDHVAGVAGFIGLAANGSISERPRAAIDFVKNKVDKKNLHFGYPGNIWEFAGTKVYVLAPPPTGAQMRKMERAGASYDRALALADGTPEGKIGWYPFTQQWRPLHRKGSGWDAGERVSTPLDGILIRYSEARDAWRRIDHLDLDCAPDLALQMDKYTNNTSLVLAFEFENGDVVLFPGDAQVGSWDSWFQIKSLDFPDVAELLKRTIFYKVGHHGSHNATLKGILETMDHSRLVAMIPTNEQFALKSKHWVMPAPKLNDALKDSTHRRLLRNDQGFHGVPKPKTQDWEGLEDSFTQTELYIDYFL